MFCRPWLFNEKTIQSMTNDFCRRMYGTKQIEWLLAAEETAFLSSFQWIYCSMTDTWSHSEARVPLRTGNKDANVANPNNEEGNCLQEKIYKVVVLPKCKIVASTEKEVGPHKKFQEMKSVCHQQTSRKGETREWQY